MRKALPDLDNLSVADKDELNRSLFALAQQVPDLAEQVIALVAKLLNSKVVFP